MDMKKITAQAAQPGVVLPPAAHRNFLLMFDLANSSPGTIGRASAAARQFVESQLGPNDIAAVAVFTTAGGAKMITSFTADRGVLRTAIETLGHPKYFKIADPLMISVNSAAATVADNSGTGQGGQAGGKTDMQSLISEEMEQQNALTKRVSNDELRTRLRQQLVQFGNVARILDRLQGQKQIILLSEGFDATVVTGRDLASQENRDDDEAVLSGEGYSVDTSARFGNASSNNDIQQMAELFRRSDVVLHAIDIKGIRSGSEASEGATKSKASEGLNLITRPTGGTVFKNANDMTENFARMLRQQETIYVLGFAARATDKPGKFHNLKVKVNNAPRGTRVSSRGGYYEPSNKISDLERALTLAEMLMTDAPMKDVDLSLTATTLPGPGGKARVPVLIEIPGSKLLAGITGKTLVSNLYVYAFDKNSKVVDFMQQRIALDLEKAGDTIRSSGIRYFGTLKLTPGDYAIKALLRVEDNGKTGLVRSDVTVPAFDSATILPPVLFAEASNWAMLLAPSRGDDYPYPFATGDAKFIPQNRPTVKAGSEYNVALFLYRVPLEGLGVTPSIVGVSGTPNVKLLGRTAADDRGGVKLLFNFKPENIPAGSHELRFTVKTKDGNESVVTMPFTIL
jgi:VWFA-related protein